MNRRQFLQVSPTEIDDVLARDVATADAGPRAIP